MKKLQQKLGYTFKNKKLLTQALTHSSLTADIHRNYERLEFLGDRILGLTVADMLCHTFDDEPEGSLAQRFVVLVCKEMVADIMRELDVPKSVNAANADVSNKDNVLCDVGEALIAAVYLDSGSLDTAMDVVRRLWQPHIDKKSQPKKDYKTMLQEKAALLKLPTPVYEVIAKSGLEHEPIFMVQASLGKEYATHGQGPSKKHAEQEAAAAMLNKLGQPNAG